MLLRSLLKNPGKASFYGMFLHVAKGETFRVTYWQGLIGGLGRLVVWDSNRGALK